MNEWMKVTTGWQPHSRAPKDGTPILVSGDGTIGVFYWEDRASQLGIWAGKQRFPCWRVVFFLTDLNPVMEHFPDGTTSPLESRIVQVDGLDEPFMWQPLPEQHDAKKGAD